MLDPFDRAQAEYENRMPEYHDDACKPCCPCRWEERMANIDDDREYDQEKNG